jgi:ribosomal protein S18 acetylase RimI-like enzyme
MKLATLRNGTRDGRLAVKDYPGLLWRRLKGTTDAILIIKGTDPSAQGRGLQTLLARQVERGLRAGGYRTLRSTFVETANAGSSRTYERMGGRPLQGTTFYRRAVR